MIPTRLPMPGGNARVAAAKPIVAPTVTAGVAVIDAPESNAPDDLVGGGTVGTAVVDPNVPFAGPQKPKTAGRPGAPITFSAPRVEEMVRDLTNALSPKVTFCEDMNAMRVSAEKQRLELLNKVLQSLKNPA